MCRNPRGKDLLRIGALQHAEKAFPLTLRLSPLPFRYGIQNFAAANGHDR